MTAVMVEQVTVTPEQQTAAVELVRAGDHGYARALRAAGVDGSKGQLRDYLRAHPELEAAFETARDRALERHGLGRDKLLDKLGWIAGDDGNPSQLRAIVYGLSFHGIQLTDHQTVDHHHEGEVGNPDVAAAIDRFTALADAAVRSAARERTGDAAQRALPPGES